MTTGKTIILTIKIFVGKVMSLLFNTLSNIYYVLTPYCKYIFLSLPNQAWGENGQEIMDWDFPGGLVKTLHLPIKAVRVGSLVREPRSHLPCSAVKRKKRNMGLSA